MGVSFAVPKQSERIRSLESWDKRGCGPPEGAVGMAWDVEWAIRDQIKGHAFILRSMERVRDKDSILFHDGEC